LPVVAKAYVPFFVNEDNLGSSDIISSFSYIAPRFISSVNFSLRSGKEEPIMREKEGRKSGRPER
jgi:hypothetical protein